MASAHLELVLNKCQTLYSGQSMKKSSSFFGLLRDRGGEETQARTVAIVLQCLGQAAVHAKPQELEGSVGAIVDNFLLPCLQVDNCFVIFIRSHYFFTVSPIRTAVKATKSGRPP